jgi:hypothetical protein
MSAPGQHLPLRGSWGTGSCAPKAAARSARLYRQHATQDGPKAIPLVRRRAEEYYLPSTIDGWFQRQCIPLSRIALRHGAAQGEIDPEGAVAAEISSSIGMLSGMLRRMSAILPRRPGRLAAFSF